MNKSTKFSFIRILILLFFGSLALGQFQRIQLTPDIAFYLHDILMGFIYASVLFVGRKNIHLPKSFLFISKTFLLFTLSLIISLLLWAASGKVDILNGSLYLFRFIFYCLSFPAFFILRKSGVISKSLHYPLMTMGVGLMATGIVQRVFIPDTRNFVLLGWDDHLYRSIGSLLDPNFLGLMLVLSLLLIIKMSFKKKPAVTGLLLLTLLFTYSRSSFLAFMSAFTVLGIQKASKKIIALAVSIIVVGALLLPRPGGEGIRLERTASIVSRLNSQKASLDIFSNHPIFGIGFNNYKSFVVNQTKYDFTPSHPSGPDNSFMLILLTTGIVGAASFALFCYALLRTYARNSLILPSVIAVGVHSLFNNSLFYPWVLIWLIVIFCEDALMERS